MSTLLEMKNIIKVFSGGVVANDDISIDVKQGEVLSILGENGAGKSTLMNILSGVLQPSAGEIFLEGRKAEFESARDAIQKGIGMSMKCCMERRHLPVEKRHPRLRTNHLPVLMR